MIEKCTNCARSGKNCIPRILSFSSADLLQWCKERKKVLNISNAEIADKTNVPKGTIDRLFSAHEYTEFRFSSIQPIVCLLLGCKPEELDCDAAYDSEENWLDQIKQKDEQLDELRVGIERIKSEHDNTLSFTRGYMKYQRRIISVLGSLLIFTLLLIIVALIVDRANPNIGFFWTNGNQ